MRLLVIAAVVAHIAAAGRPARQVDPAALRTERSPMMLRASGAKYAGVLKDEIEIASVEEFRKRRDPDWMEARSEDRLFFPAHFTWSPEGLGTYRIGATTGTSYPMSQLVIAAGWYAPPVDDPYFPDFIRGVAVAGGKVWMGSAGLGIAALDLRDGTWARYDVKSRVLPGIHSFVLYGDDEYLFAKAGGPSGDWKKQLPDARDGDLGPSLEVYSLRRDRWIRITGVPREDVMQFRWTRSDLVSIPCETRQYAKRRLLPMEMCTWPDYAEAAPSRGGYLLWTEFAEPGEPLRYVIRKDLLEAAFDTAQAGRGRL